MMAPMLAALRAQSPVGRILAHRTVGERRAIAALVAIVAGALAWIAVWQPITRDSAAMQAARADRIVALAGARRMADEIAGLARTPAPPSPVDVREAVDRMLDQHGLRPAVTQLDWQDGRARLVFAAVRYESLVAALDALQRTDGVRVFEAMLAARVEPGTVRAELTLAR
jgi:type II secretory pathway component PulM